MTFVFALGAYLLGSLPTGYLFFRATEKKDIRHFGSRSTGATNVLRLRGWKSALPVAVIDVFKGFLPALLAQRIFGDPRAAVACASLAVVGHCFPVYIGFRGGKGVATAAGAMFAISLRPALLSVAVFVIVVALTRYVSLGSMLAAVTFPFFMLLFGISASLIFLSLPILAVILIRHQTNVGRLIRGTERKLGHKSEAGA